MPNPTYFFHADTPDSFNSIYDTIRNMRIDMSDHITEEYYARIQDLLTSYNDPPFYEREYECQFIATEPGYPLAQGPPRTETYRERNDGGGIRMGDLVNIGPDGNIITQASDGDFRMVNPYASPNTTYKGCSECHRFSMLFGSPSIRTEEEFEGYKNQFVEHFNEKHQDLMEKRKPYEKKRFESVTPQKPPEHNNNFNDPDHCIVCEAEHRAIIIDEAPYMQHLE